MAIICQQCKTRNQEIALYCSECGLRLDKAVLEKEIREPNQSDDDIREYSIGKIRLLISTKLISIKLAALVMFSLIVIFLVIKGIKDTEIKFSYSGEKPPERALRAKADEVASTIKAPHSNLTQSGATAPHGGLAKKSIDIRYELKNTGLTEFDNYWNTQLPIFRFDILSGESLIKSIVIESGYLVLSACITTDKKSLFFVACSPTTGTGSLKRYDIERDNLSVIREPTSSIYGHYSVGAYKGFLLIEEVSWHEDTVGYIRTYSLIDYEGNLIYKIGGEDRFKQFLFMNSAGLVKADAYDIFTLAELSLGPLDTKLINKDQVKSTNMHKLLYEQKFSIDVFANYEWSRSNDSVFIDKSNRWLQISSNGNYDDYAETSISITLPATIETKYRLVSGGRDYLLPYLMLYHGTGIRDFLVIGYLPGNEYGWSFGPYSESWHRIHQQAPASENEWCTLKAIIRQDGGELYRGNNDNESYEFIHSTSWFIPNQIIKIRFSQPWDAVCNVEYISIWKDVQ